jgi:hypothetical protein
MSYAIFRRNLVQCYAWRLTIETAAVLNIDADIYLNQWSYSVTQGDLMHCNNVMIYVKHSSKELLEHVT